MVPSHPIIPTFMAPYPGSRDKMTLNLIEAMKGLVTSNEFQLNGHEIMAPIKMHYPSHEIRQVPGSDNIPSAIHLFRSTLHSIPSFHNYIYEMENQL